MDSQTVEQVQLMRAFLEHCGDGNLGQLDKILAAFGDKSGTENDPETDEEKLHPVLTLTDPHGRTGLHLAASRGHEAVCKRLLKLTKNPRAYAARCDSAGMAPLHHAAMAGHKAVAHLLLIVAPQAALLVTGSGTALHHAAMASEGSIAELLLRYGVDANKTDEQGNPPLFIAAVQGSLPVVEALLAGGAQPDFKTSGGISAVHVAAELGFLEVLKALVKAGGDVNSRTSENQRAIDLASAQDIVEYLYPITSLHPHETLAVFLKNCQKSQKKPQNPTASSSQPSSETVSAEKKEQSKKYREEGNKEFRSDRFEEAVELYTKAIQSNPNDHVPYSNRSACYLKLGKLESALDDANSSRVLNPTDAKACFRAGSVLMEMKQYEEAAVAFFDGVKLNPDSAELSSSFQNAIKLAKEEYQEKQKAEQKAE